MLGHLGLAVAGAAGAAAYAADSPAAVFLDAEMPGVDGLEALRALRQLDPDARVALLTFRRGHDHERAGGPPRPGGHLPHV